MYWDRSLNGNWYEAHNTFGTLTPILKWGLAEGRVGQQFNFHTYILLGNPGATDAQVRVTYLKKANASNGVPVGTGTVIKNYTVTANSRFTIDVNGMVPELVNEDFGAIIEVLSGPGIVVERSLYNASGGLLFAAGTNTTAVHLQ